MYKRPVFVLLFSISLASTGSAQTPDTARLRAAYDAVTALRSDYERSHGRFVNVNGIKMHYLEWGDARGTPLVWAHNTASAAYDIRAVAHRRGQLGILVLLMPGRGYGALLVDTL